MNVGSITTAATQKVTGPYSLAAFKKANEVQKDAALKLIQSLPTPKPIVSSNKVDILA